jgi:cytochrome b561
VKFFGVVLQDFIIKNKDIGEISHEIHEVAPYVLLAVIGLHVAGALKHRFIDSRENDVLGAMLLCNHSQKTGE